MKIFFLFITCLIFQSSIAKTDTTFLNIESLKCPRKTAVTYRIATKQNDNYQVKQFILKNDQLQMVANCSSLEPLIKNGKTIYYFETGKKSSEGNYINDVKAGLWTIWDESGTDSTVVECFKEGNYKNIFISPKHITLNNQLDTLYPTNVAATFPGGQMQMQKFIGESIQFPPLERDAGINGKCYVAFTIEKDGSLNNIGILERGTINTIGYNNEAVRIVQSMPKWQPAMELGRPTTARFYLPIVFTVKNITQDQFKRGKY